MEKIKSSSKEEICWLGLAEKSVVKLWNNIKDDEVWSKYL